MKKYIYIILLILSFGAEAQKISFTIKAPGAVEVGESFQVVYTINQNGRHFQGPTFSDFNYQGGPYTSSSSSYQNINGVSSHNISNSYTYQLQAVKVGKFKLPAATVKVGGKTYKSNTKIIEVVKGNNPATTSNTATNGSINPQKAPEGILFGRTFVSKKSVYVGEPVLVTQKIYSKERISDVKDFKEPAYDGFWKESIDIGQLKLAKESYANQVYFVVTLQKMILFPQKAGKLEIGSFDLKTVIGIKKTRKPRDPMEQWTYGNKVPYMENSTLSINSPKVYINVKPLPETGKPSDFTGVVGKFSMTASINKNEIEANDAITLKINIKGNGNIDLLDISKPEFPSDFEVYDPKINTKSNNSVAGVSGSKSYEYLVIPRNEGYYEIPPVKFSYFDVNKGKYVNLKSDTFRIKVGKGKSGEILKTQDAINRTDVKYLGQDIRYIKTKVNDWQPIGYHFFNSLWHLLLLVLFPIILIVAVLFNHNRRKQQSDIMKMRNKKATKVAKKRLRNADKLLKSDQQTKFFIEISRVLWGYLSDKFSIPISELSMDNVRERLTNKIDSATIEEVIQILEKSEFARFAPSNNSSDSKEIYDETLKIISQIEKKLRA